MIKKLSFLFFIGLFFNKLNASVITATASTNWATPSTWSSNSVPTNSDDVVIPNGFTVAINSAQPANSLSISGNGRLNFTSAGKTLTLTTSLILSGTDGVTGSATGVLNAATFSVSAAATATIGRLTMTISGTSEIDGKLSFTSATGTPTFTGDVTFGSGGIFYFTAAQTAVLSGNLIMPSGGIIDGSVSPTGIVTVAGNFTVGTSGGTGTVTIGEAGFTNSAGTTVVNGVLLFSNATGTKNFNNITINAGGVWNRAPSIDQTYNIVGGNLTNNGTFNAGNTNATIYNFTSTSQINGTITIPTFSVQSGTTTNNGTLTISNQLEGGGIFTQGAAGYLYYSSSSDISVNTFNASAASNTVDFTYAGAQNIIAPSTSYYNLTASTSGTKLLKANTTVLGNLKITGTAKVDVDAVNNYSLTVGGSWTNSTSTAFLSEAGTVIFNGTSAQNITAASLPAGEVFYNLNISNTSGSNPGVQINQNQTLLGSTTLNFLKTTTLTVTGNLTMNSGSVITGTTTGVFNVNGTFSDVAAGSETIDRVTMNVTGASSLAGTLTLSSATGTKSLNGGLTLANNSNITYGAAATLAVGTSLTCNGTNSITYSTAGTFSAAATTINGATTIDGAATGTTTFGSTLGVAAAANLNLGNTAATATGASTITGSLTITSATGAKSLSGGATLANGSHVTFSAAGTLTIGTSLTCNGTNTITYSAAGTFSSAATTINGTTTIDGTTTGTTNFTSTLGVAAAGVLNIGNTNLTTTGAVTLDGKLVYTVVGGTKTFGNITIDAGGTWDASAVDQTYNIATGNLTNNGTFKAGATSATIYSFTGVSQVNGTLTIPSMAITSGTTTNNATLTISNQLSGAGSFTQGAAGYLYYAASAAISVTTFVASVASNTVNYNYAGAQTIKNGTYYNLIISTSGIKALSGATIVSNNLNITNTAQLDASATNYALTVGGNWTNSTSLPFISEAGTVTFNGTSLQNITAASLPAGEVFYNLTISNTSGSNPGVLINQNQTLLGSTTLNFTQTTTLTITGNLIMNSGSTIDGSATGVLNVNGTFSDVAAGSETIGRVTMNVTGASSIAGTLTLSNATGAKNLNGGLTMANGSNITYGAAATLIIGTSLTCNGTNSVSFSTAGTFSSTAATINGTTTFDGATTGITNFTSTLGVAAAATLNLGNTVVTVTGASTLTGSLIVTSASGAKSLNGAVTLANGGNITFSAAATLTVGNTLTCNGTNTITYSAAGILAQNGAATVNGTTTIGGTTTGTTNFATTLGVAAAGILNIGNTNLTVTGATSVSGTIAFTNTGGTKTFSNITINSGGTWNASAIDQTYNIAAGNLTNNGTFNAGATVATVYNFTGVSQVNGTLTIPSFSVATGGTTTNNATLTISNQLSGAGSFTQGATGYLYYSASASIAVTTFVASAASNTVDYTYAGAQTVLGATYYNLITSTSGIKTLSGATIVNKNLSIIGTTQLDVSASNYALSVAGNWSVTSTNADPFVEESGTVTLNGGSGTQSITTVLAGGEVFNSLTITNSSATSPGLQLQQSITVNGAYNHTAGKLDLKGNNLNITGAPSSSQTSNFTAGSIITSVAGSTITVSDANNVKIIYFKGTNFGDATNGVAITCSSNDSYFNGSIFYGNVAFIKTGTGGNDCTGGNIFYGPCSFSTVAAGDRWRMANTNPDIFYNATFSHYNTGGNNFIIARQTIGNQFYGTTTFYSESPGGIYTGRDNTGANGSADFHGPVYITVAKTGTVYFAESNATIQNTTTFEDIIQVNSIAASTGDVSFGTSAQSIVNLTSNARFIAGTILGATTVYLYGVTQTGTTYTHTINSTANGSALKIGVITGASPTFAPSQFAGSLNFSFPTIYMAASTFNGATNMFAATGTVTSTSYNGNNTFAVGTSTTFSNSGTGAFGLGISAIGPDAFNGDVTFIQTGTGTLSPTYSSNSTFGGNISTTGTTKAITFGASSGTVTVNGTGTQTFSGSSTYTPIITNLIMNATGPLTLSVPVNISGTLALTSGLINTDPTNILTMQNGATLSTALSTSATSYINGPMDCQLATATKTALKFPVGTGGDCRPISLLAQNTTANLYNYTTQLYAGSAFSAGTYTNYPATVDTLSGVHYWQIARTNSVSVSSPTLEVSGNQQVTLYFDTDDQVYDGGLLTVCKTSTNTTNWVDIGQASTTIGASQFAAPQVGSITSSLGGPTLFTSFSYFTLGRLNGAGKNPLPIELLSFSAVPNEEKVDIKWETITETDNAYFTIEKSKDGKTFTKLIDVPGAGNSTSYRNYAETDYQPYNGVSYYRLKQTDKNGNFKYFTMVPVNFNIQKNIVLYPNPIDNTSNLNIQIKGYQDEEVVVVLRDAQGREFLSKVLLSQGDNQIFIVDETKSLTPGSYIVTASSNDKIYNYKLIVK